LHKPVEFASYLSVEHGSWRNFHVMTQLEIRKERDSLSHTDVSIRLKAHIRHRSTRVYISDHILSDDVESR
jgi:hypothetical protein